MSSRPAFRFLAAGLVAVVFLAGDWGVRQLYLLLWKKPFQDLHPHRVRNEIYHHGILPNQVSEDIYGPFRAPYFSNSLGFRDGKVRDVPMVSDEPRILFIGDSFTEAGPIPWQKTFVGLVAEALSKKQIEVLNAGVASYCPEIMAAKIRYYLKDQGLRVDRVVVFIDISDVKDELFYRKDDAGCVQSVPYGPFHEDAKDLARIDDICNWLEVKVEKNFVIVGAAVRNLRLQWRRHTSKTGVMASDEIPDWAYNWPDYKGPYANFVEQGLKKAKDNMTQLAGFLHQERIPLTVVVYPWPQQVRAGTRPSRAETEWGNWVRENGGQFISLFPVFVNQEPAGQIIQKYYWKNDAHWNEEGHRLVAEALLQPERGILLPRKNTVESKTQPRK
jgi:hypothetical protein